MEKQFDDLLKVYKDFIKIFNNWETSKNEDLDYANYDLLVRTYLSLTDILVWNNIIEKEGIKHYRVVKTGEII